MLIEVLVSVLILAVGILGLVGLQANSIKQASGAQYRSIAAMQAQNLIAQMWMNNPSDITSLQSNFAGTGSSGGAAYNTWLANLKTSSGLPSASATVSFPSTTSSLATIQITWTAPGDVTTLGSTTLATHTYTTTVQVGD